MPYQINRKFAASLAVLALAQVTICKSVEAAELGTDFNTSYIYTDNVFLTENDTVSDNVWTVGATFSYFEQTNRSLIDIQALVNHRKYGDSYDDETLGSLAALLEFDLIEDRFSWMFSDNYGQSMPNPLSQPTPENRENINVFTTGPDINFALGDRSSISFEARYDSVKYEKSTNDNERLSALLRFIRQSNSSTALSMNLGSSKIKYTENIVFDEFDVHEAFVRYEKNSNRNVVNLDIGVTQFDREGIEADGFLLRANWTRILSGSKELTLRAGSEYSTQGDVFRLSQGNDNENGDLGDTIDVNGGRVPFYYNYFLARYSIVRERTEFSIEASWSQDDFSNATPVFTALDRDIYGAKLNFRRDLSRKTFLSLFADFRNRDYKDIDRTDDDLRAGASFGYRFTDSFNLSLAYQYYDRSSDNGQQEFTENRATLTLEYTPPWGETSRR